MSYEIDIAKHIIKFECSCNTTQEQNTAETVDTPCLSIKYEPPCDYYGNYKCIVSYIRSIFKQHIKSAEKKYEDIDHKILDTLKKIECIKQWNCFKNDSDDQRITLEVTDFLNMIKHECVDIVIDIDSATIVLYPSTNKNFICFRSLTDDTKKYTVTCVYCTDCINCYNCFHCSDCMTCNHCKFCDFCKDCRRCEYSKQCIECSYLQYSDCVVYSRKCEYSSHVYRSENIDSCNYIYNSFDTMYSRHISKSNDIDMSASCTDCYDCSFLNECSVCENSYYCVKTTHSKNCRYCENVYACYNCRRADRCAWCEGCMFTLCSNYCSDIIFCDNVNHLNNSMFSNNCNEIFDYEIAEYCPTELIKYISEVIDKCYKSRINLCDLGMQEIHDNFCNALNIRLVYTVIDECMSQDGLEKIFKLVSTVRKQLLLTDNDSELNNCENIVEKESLDIFKNECNSIKTEKIQFCTNCSNCVDMVCCSNCRDTIKTSFSKYISNSCNCNYSTTIDLNINSACNYMSFYCNGQCLEDTTKVKQLISILDCPCGCGKRIELDSNGLYYVYDKDNYLAYIGTQIMGYVYHEMSYQVYKKCYFKTSIDIQKYFEDSDYFASRDCDYVELYNRNGIRVN